MTRSNASELRRCANLFVALLMSWALVLTGGGMRGYAYADEVADDGAEGEEYSLEELAAGYSNPSDEGFLTLTEASLRTGLEESLDTTQYVIDGIQARYVSQEYLDELAYNSKSNIYFGYTLEELDSEFQGTRYVFDLGDDGQTTVHEFEAYTDEYAQLACQIATNVAIGAGVIVLCAVLTPVAPDAAAASPIIAFFYRAVQPKMPPRVALGSAALGGILSGAITGFQTGDVEQAVKAAAAGASEDFKWGAIIGVAAGGINGGANFAAKYLSKIPAVTNLASKVTVTLEKLTEGIAKKLYIVKDIRKPLTAVTHGFIHPKTGVQYLERYIIQTDGKTVVHGFFPKFSPTFETSITRDLYKASDYTQFKQCTMNLYEAIQSDANLASKFTAEQIELISKGKTPKGYVWHHNEEEGVMQLVDSATHAGTPHVGGDSIWGNRMNGNTEGITS